MCPAPEFTDSEIATVREILVQHYQAETEIQLADAEPGLDPKQPQLTACPTIFWHQRNTNFVIFKLAPSRFRARFFYTPRDQYGAGINEFDSLEACVTSVLQTASGHEREREEISSAGSGDNLN